jgi:hypothetical protein
LVEARIRRWSGSAFNRESIVFHDRRSSSGMTLRTTPATIGSGKSSSRTKTGRSGGGGVEVAFELGLEG